MTARDRANPGIGAGILLALCLAAPPAAAESAPGDAARAEPESGENPPGLGGWSPSLGAEFGVHLEEFNGSVSSSFGPSGQRKRVLSTLELRLDGRVLGPGSGFLPGRPRPVFHAGIGLPMRSSATLLSASQLLGTPNQSQGENRAEVSVDWHLSWFAGAGLQFPLPIDYDVRLTPALEYLGSRLGYGAEISTQAPPNPITNPFPTRFILEGSPDSFVRHFLGPRLTGEFVFLRVGHSVLSLFLDGRLYWNLGEREREFRFNGLVSGVPQSGSVRIESGRLVSHVGFGLRGSY